MKVEHSRNCFKRWPFKTDLLITDRSKQTIQNRPRS